MSEKERQKKDGRDKNKKNQAMREHEKQNSNTDVKKDKPATYGEGLARNDRPESKR